MADFEVTFLEQMLPNPFLLEIDPFISPVDIPLSKYYGGILISAFPYELNDRVVDNISLAEKYLQNVADWNSAVNMPVIASVDADMSLPIEDYCLKIEQAGAHALHLRLFFFPDDRDFRSADYEKIFLENVAKIAYSIKIPLVITLPVFFTNMFNIVEQLFYRGIQGFCPTMEQPVADIDIEQFETKNDYVGDMELFSKFYLKWIYYLSSYFPRADFAVRLSERFQPEEPIKYLLAGVNALIEKFQPEQALKIEASLQYLSNWMGKNSFDRIEHFQGQLNFQPSLLPSVFERKCFLDFYNSFYQFETERTEENE